MQKIIKGIQQFQSTVFDGEKQLFERLATGQQPLALFITCSDSRIDPNLVTQTKPGELFIIRNAGNIIPPHGIDAGGEAGTIEYAVAVLKVKDIIICGHSHCGAMGGLLHPEQLTELRAVRKWLRHAEATARIIKENYSQVTDPKARLIAAIEQNVLVQLENLRTHPSVAAAISRGELQLHGWTYKFESGQIFCHDPARDKFVPLEQTKEASEELPTT